MLTTLVLVLAGITAWCVASLALALIVGPMVRSGDRARRAEYEQRLTEGRPTEQRLVERRPAERRPLTGAIPLPVVH